MTCVRSIARGGMRVVTASLLVLGTGCVTGVREPGATALVSVYQEKAQAAQLDRMAARFQWDQQRRLEKVLMDLLLEMPDAPHVTVEAIRCDAVNAQVGDGRIRVCLGTLRFVQSDDELAVVLGHELGHLPTSAHHGLLGRGQIDAEREADIRGLFYAHQAGYDIRAGARLFERMAVELASGLWDAESETHPSHAERILLAERIARLLGEGGTAKDPDVTLMRLHRLVGSFDDLP